MTTDTWTPATLKQLPPVSWRWRWWLAEGHLHLLAGDPGAGKSALALHLAQATAEGGEWPDGSPAGQGPVLYLDLESSPQAVGDRMRAFGIADDAPLTVIFPEDADGRAVARLDYFVSEVVRRRPALAVLDSLRGLLLDRENRTEFMRPAMDRLRATAEGTGACVLVVDHTNKRRSHGARGQEHIAGSRDIVAVSRVAMLLSKVDRTEASFTSSRPTWGLSPTRYASPSTRTAPWSSGARQPTPPSWRSPASSSGPSWRPAPFPAAMSKRRPWRRVSTAEPSRGRNRK